MRQPVGVVLKSSNVQIAEISKAEHPIKDRFMKNLGALSIHQGGRWGTEWWDLDNKN